MYPIKEGNVNSTADPSTATTWTVSLQGEHRNTDTGKYEDVILGTCDTKRAALALAREHVKVNPESTAQVIGAAPTDAEFGTWDALAAMVFVDDDTGELTVERY